MAISFPLDLDGFFDSLKVTTLSFMPGEALEHSGETGGGEVLTADVGYPYWSGAVHIAPNDARELDKVISKITLLRSAGGSFMIGDPRHATLENDLDGSIAQANPCTVQFANTNLREVSVEGMPGGFRLEEGDHFSIDHVDGTFSYYQAVESAPFDSLYDPPRVTIEVRPELSIKVAPGMAVQVYKPALKAVYVPGSYAGGARTPSIADGVSFRWRQTLL